MNFTSPQFKEFCTDLSEKQKNIFSNYLKKHCPSLGSTDGIPAIGYENYLYRLYWLATRSQSRSIIELGARPGGSSMALLLALQNTTGQLWSCDIATIEDDQMSQWGIDDSKRTIVGHCPASDFGKSWTLEGRGKVDMIYLDTSHEYGQTVEEIDAWLPNLKEGGLFVFHDTDVYKSHVLKAIMEAMIKFDKMFEFHAFPDCHGHGVLQWFSQKTIPYAESGVMQYNKNDSIVSLTSLLLNAKNG